MAQLMHIRLDDGLKDQMDQIVKDGFYGSITEFTKEAIRNNIREHQKAEIRRLLGSAKGSSSKTQITSKDRLEILKEMGFEL